MKRSPMLSVHWHESSFQGREARIFHACVDLESWNAVLLAKPEARKIGWLPTEYGADRGEARRKLAARLKPAGVKLAARATVSDYAQKIEPGYAHGFRCGIAEAVQFLMERAHTSPAPTLWRLAAESLRTVPIPVPTSEGHLRCGCEREANIVNILRSRENRIDQLLREREKAP